MRFKYSLRLLFPNFGAVYKSLLYRLIVLAVGAALSAALILPNILFLIQSAELSAVVSSIRSAIRSFFGGERNSETIRGALDALGALVASKKTKIVWACVWALVVYLCTCFLNGLADYTLGKLVNEHMQSFTHRGFSSTFLGGLRDACLYEAVNLGVTFACNLVILGAAIGIGVGLLGVIGVFAPPLAFLAVAALVSLRQTLFASLMPARVTGGSSFRDSFAFCFGRKPKEFWRTFATYFASFYFVVIAGAAALLFTFFTAAILLIPAAYLFYVIMQFVNYYSVTGRKYYVDYDHIVVPKQLRKEEKILDQMDI